MENPYDPIVVAIGLERLTGKALNRADTAKILEKYPASQWLDLFAKVEGLLQISKLDIINPRNPLNLLFFGDRVIDYIERKKDGGAVVFSLGQLNVLRKLAILHCPQNCAVQEIPMQMEDIATVLLAGQDFQNAYDEKIGLKGDLDNFAQFIVRNGYLNINCDAPNLFTRAHHIFVDAAQNIHYEKAKSFADFFKETLGMDLEEYMSLSFALANPFFWDFDNLLGSKAQTTIIDPSTFFKNLDADQQATEEVIQSLTIDFAEAKKILEKEVGTQDLNDIPFGYNLDLFKKHPLIRLDDGKLACGNVVSLLEKTTQNLIWQIKSKLQSTDVKAMKTLVRKLTSYRGKVFEEYVKTLCKLMAKKSPKLKFHHITPEQTEDHEEVGDSILVQGKKILIIEAKSRQFTEGFKYTGDWNQDKLFMDELLKKASEQIDIAAKKILAGDLDIVKDPSKVRRIYPVIITFEPVPMHGKMQRFIREKVKEYGFLQDAVFAPLEIIDINDIELSMDCVNTVTPIELIEKKQSQDLHSSETNFHNFLSNHLGKSKINSNGWQKTQFDKLCEEVFRKKLKFKS